MYNLVLFRSILSMDANTRANTYLTGSDAWGNRQHDKNPLILGYLMKTGNFISPSDVLKALTNNSVNKHRIIFI